MKLRKGQIEMIGLVIVVVLLAIGLLLYVKLVVFKEGAAKQDVSVENAYLTNLMGAVFNVKICSSDPIKVEEGIINCFNGMQICGEEACRYLKDQIKEIIGDINLKKYKNYSIWVTKGSENRTIMTECKTGLLTYTTVVTPDKEHYTAYFRVC